MADRAPSLDDLLASSTPSLDDLIAAPQSSNFDFSGARTGNAAPRAVTNRLANPDAIRETEERNQRDRARQSKPIETDGLADRVGTKFWQRIRGMGAGGGRLVGAALEELGFDPNGEAAQWLRAKSQSGEEYSNRPVEGETTWNDLKASVRAGEIPKSVGQLARYVIEQAGSSAADMLSLSSGAGIAPYVALQAGSTGQQRAQNNDEMEATAEDVFKALPSAIGSAALERLGIHGIFGAGAKKVAGRIAQAFGAEALTEALQSPVEYAGSNLGTKRGFDPMEALDQAAAGAVAGGFMGGALRAGLVETPGAAMRRLRREETGAPAPAGMIEQAEVTPVTPDDEASPLPTDLIAQGKAIAGTSTAASDANGILSANGAPAVGSKVSVTVGGKTRTGTIRDAFVDESDAELGAQPGLNIDLEGGGQMREYFADLRDAGVTLEQVEQAQRDIAAADLTPSETLDAIAQTGETPAVAAPEAVPTLDELTAAGPLETQVTPRARAGFDMAAYMGRARQAESGGNDGASNTRSSASGRYQFTDGTFTSLYRKVYGADAQAGAKNDPAVQERLMERFTADNAAGLRKAGVEVNDATVYAAHHFGLGGALDMVRNPSAAVDAAVVKANPQFRGMTNAEALAWTARHIGAQTAQQGDTAAPIAPVELDENDRPRQSDQPLSTAQVEAPARTPDPEPVDTTEAVVSDQPVITATVTETRSGKSIAIAGASEAELAAISQAVPNVRPTPNKTGSLVYAAKYRPQIEAALSTSTAISTLEANNNRLDTLASSIEPRGGTRRQVAEAMAEQLESKLPTTADEGRYNPADYADEQRQLSDLRSLLATDKLDRLDADQQQSGMTRMLLQAARDDLRSDVTEGRVSAQEAAARVERARATGNTLDAVDAIDGADYTDTAVTSTGREVPVRYKVVEASDLVASNDADGNPNPDYPQNLQPRDRTRGASVAQVTDIAANLNPRLLGRSVKASDGAPIVSAGNVVESGNARTLALRRAYESNGPQAQRYREFLQQEGFDTTGFREPVLVRERGPMADADVEAFTREANARDTLGYSATEQGVSDAKAMTPGVLDLFRGGELDAAGNRDFVRAFLGSVVPQSELSQMVASDGSMSQAAVARVRGALLARAYSSEKIVADAVEATDTDVKAIVGALTDVAGRWAQMAEAAKDNRIEPAMDLTKNLTEAVALVSRARREGRAVADLVGQTDMFGGSLDARTEALLRLFFNKADFTKPAARQRVAERLSYYVDEALKSQPGGGLFGEQTSPDNVVALAQRKGTDNGGGEQSNLFGPGTARDVAAEPARSAADAGPGRESVPAPDREQTEDDVASQRGTPRDLPLDPAPETEGVTAGETAPADIEQRVSDIEERLARDDAASEPAPEAARLSRTEPSVDEGVQDLESIRTQLAAEAERMGVGADRLVVKVVDRLLGDPNIAGMYLRGVISVAAEANVDPRRTLDHEFIHALRDMGLFRPAEWAALERAARGDQKLMAKARQLYPELNEDGLAEEAVARMFENWKGNRRGFVGTALGRIADMIAFVRRLVSKVDTSGDIMRRINRGEIGARDGGQPQADGAKLSIIGSSAANPNPTTVSEALERAQTFVGRLAEGYEKWRIAMQDRMLPVLRAEVGIERVFGRGLQDNESPYLAEELTAGRTAAKIDHLGEDLIDPLWASLEAEKISTDELESYLYAKHAPERNAYIAKINPDFAQGEGSGMTDIEAAAILARIDKAGRTDAFARAADRVYRILQFARDERLDAGLLSQEQADSWNSAYQFYVPLRGFAELDGADETRPNQGGSGLTVRGAESKRAFGRRSRADDILAHTIMQGEEAIVRGEKNRVARAFYDLAKAAPDETFWVADKVSVERSINQTTGLVESRTVNRLLAADEPMTVSLKIDGKEHRVTMVKSNPQAVKLAEAMRRLDEQKTSGALVMLGKINRFLSTVNTSLNPEFVITNAFRDVQTAAVNLSGIDVANIRRGTLKDWRAAMVGSTKASFGNKTGEWGRWAQEFTDAGGRVAYNQMQSVDELNREMAKRFDPKRRPNPNGLNRSPKQLAMIALGDAKAAYGFIEKLNNGVENGIRLAAYKNAREAGLTPARAASIAKNLTTNFNRKGTKATLANSLYLFYNASVQGSARIIMAMQSRKVQKIVAGIVIAGAAQEWLNMMLSGDDDDGEKIYDKISDFEKEHNIIIMAKGPWGEYLKLPMPYGYSFFHTFGRNMARLTRGEKFGDIAGDTMMALVDSFNPIGGTNSLLNMMAPTFVDPLVDLTLNRDFANRPIMPDENKLGPTLPDNQRYWNNVSPVWKEVASVLNQGSGGDEIRPGAIDVSPETLEYMFGVVTGATGAFIDRTVGGLVKAVDADPTTEFGVNDIPLVRKVAGAKPTWYDKAAFYARLNEVDQSVDYAKGYGQRVGKEAMTKFVEEDRPLLGLMPLAKAARAEMSGARKAKGELQLAHDLKKIDDGTYRERMKQIADGEKRVVTAFNKQYLQVIDQPLRP